MPNFEEDYENTVKSKAALDLARALKLYNELTESGWPRDKAFLVAFMGVAVWYVPGLKPLPEPDPPFFSVSALYETIKKAHVHVSSYKAHIEDDLKFLKAFIEKQARVSKASAKVSKARNSSELQTHQQRRRSPY